MAKGKQKKSDSSKVLEELGRYKALALMVGGFVHQLRTPIHIIQSGAEGMMEGTLPVELKAQVDMISRSAQRLDTSVTAVLNFVKGVKPSLRPAPLNETLEQLGDFLKDECRKRSITIEKVLHSKASILQDPLHLQEALLNILMNALQAMPRGGVLTLHTDDFPLQKKVILEIKDTGTGMDLKKMSNHLAEPFHTTKKQGMGLGLFFTKNILALHHAKLVYTSKKGRGTTARMVFPAV